MGDSQFVGSATRLGRENAQNGIWKKGCCLHERHGEDAIWAFTLMVSEGGEREAQKKLGESETILHGVQECVIVVLGTGGSKGSERDLVDPPRESLGLSPQWDENGASRLQRFKHLRLPPQSTR